LGLDHLHALRGCCCHHRGGHRHGHGSRHGDLQKQQQRQPQHKAGV
jgi:hypothetical protein